MSINSYDYSFLNEEGTEKRISDDKSDLRSSFTYYSHPGYTLFVNVVDGLKEGSAVLQNEYGCTVVECAFHNNLLDGRYVSHTPFGILQETGYYANGVKEGVFQEYDDKGSPVSVMRFSNGSFMSSFVPVPSLPGYWKEVVDTTQDILSVAKYTSDFSSRDGLCFIYENGAVKRGELYSGGKMVRVTVEFNGLFRTEFDGNGEKAFVGQFNPSVDSLFCREGKGCVLQNGKVKRVSEFKEGKEVRVWKVMEDGMATEYDESGSVAYYGEYAENLFFFCPRNGRGTVYENGVMKEVSWFENGLVVRREKVFEGGEMMEYDRDGQLVYRGGYVEDEGDIVRNGRGEVYKNGELQCVGVFEKGEVVKKEMEIVDGTLQVFDKRGRLVYEGEYQFSEGKLIPAGQGMEYRRGKPYREGIYEDGQIKILLNKYYTEVPWKNVLITASSICVALLLSGFAVYVSLDHPSIAGYMIGGVSLIGLVGGISLFFPMKDKVFNGLSVGLLLFVLCSGCFSMQHDSNTLLLITGGMCIVAAILILVRITMHEMKLERVLLLTVVDFVLFFVPFPFLFFGHSPILIVACYLLIWMGVVFLTTYVCFSYGLTDSRILLINIHIVCFFINSCVFCFVDGTSPVFVVCGGLLLYMLVVGVMDMQREKVIISSIITSRFAFYGYWVLVILWSVLIMTSHFQWLLFCVVYVESSLLGIMSSLLCAKKNTPFPSRFLPLLLLFLGSCYAAVMPILCTHPKGFMVEFLSYATSIQFSVIMLCCVSCGILACAHSNRPVVLFSVCSSPFGEDCIPIQLIHFDALMSNKHPVK